jgi:hypothetical protein
MEVCGMNEARYAFGSAVEFALQELAPVGGVDPTDDDYVVAGEFGWRMEELYREDGAHCSNLRAYWWQFLDGALV